VLDQTEEARGKRKLDKIFLSKETINKNVLEANKGQNIVKIG